MLGFLARIREVTLGRGPGIKLTDGGAQGERHLQSMALDHYRIGQAIFLDHFAVERAIRYEESSDG
jgi:hypothetical protein